MARRARGGPVSARPLVRLLARALAMSLALARGSPPEAIATEPDDVTVEVPGDLQLKLIAKVLGYEHELAVRAGNELVLGLLYQSQYRVSLNVKEEILPGAGEHLLRILPGTPARCVPIDLSGEKDWAAAIERLDLDVLYVAPLRAFDLEELTALTRRLRIRTVTGVPRYVETGVAMGIGTRGGKPLIIVNLPAAKAEGADYSSQVLALARLVP